MTERKITQKSNQNGVFPRIKVMAGSAVEMPHSISPAVALQNTFRRRHYTLAAGDGLSYFLPYLIRLRFRGSNVEAGETTAVGISRGNRVNCKFRCNSVSQLILI